MNREYLTTITEKLQQASRYSILQKKRQRQQIEGQMITIETSIQERREREDFQLAQAQSKMEQIGRYLDETIKSMAFQSSKQSEKVVALREQLETKIECSQKEHQENVQEILEKTEENILSVNQQIQKKYKSQKQKIEFSLNTLSKKLLGLQRQFKDESQNRKNGAERIKNRLYDQLQQFKQIVERQRERRISAQRKIQAMVEEIEQKLEQEISASTCKRKKNNESVLKLIQLACLKIEQKYQQ